MYEIKTVLRLLMRPITTCLILTLIVLGGLAGQLQASSAYSNFPSGVGVGTESASTYTYMTGVAEVWKEIPVLGNVFTGSNGTTALADTAITTGLFVKQLTGLTNNAGVAFPVELDTAVASIPFTVPLNYRSGARIVLGWHANSTFTAGALSFTASAYVNDFFSTTTTAVTAGTVVQLNTVAAHRLVTQTATISSLSVNPLSTVTLKISKVGTLVEPQLTRAWFVYRPGGFLDGR